jgi:hypothetical protein
MVDHTGKIRLGEALDSKWLGNEYSGVGNDYSKMVWHDGNKDPKPTEEEVKAEMDRLQAEYDGKEYARKRQAEYPTIEELVVALYDTEDKAAIDAKRAEIKLKYPKGV